MLVVSTDFALQMPLANQKGFVAAFLQFLGKPGGGCVDFTIEVFNTVDVAVLAGDKAGPARGANGVGADEIVEAQAFFAEAVDGGVVA